MTPANRSAGKANVELVGKVGQLTSTGFANPDKNLFAADFVIHFSNPQLPDIAGDYHGVEGFIALFERLRERSDSDFRSKPRSMTPFGDELVVSFATHTLGFGGEVFDIDAIVVWRVFDGRLREAWDIPAVNTVRPHQSETE